MAQAKTVKGTKLLIMIGDGETPESFVHTCSVSAARSFQLQAQTNDVNVPDCDDPELMAWVESEKISLQATLQGAGVVNSPDIKTLQALVTQSDPVNCRVVVDVAGADGGGYWEGAFLFTDFTISGDRGQKADLNFSAKSSGAVEWVDAA